MKLSKEDVVKLNFNGLYSHRPDVKYRGKLYADDLYWCFNWIFKVKECTHSDTGEKYYKMIDTYYGDKGIELTNENFNEFKLIFDFDDVREISKEASYNYNDEDVYQVAIGSGGWRYDRKYFVNKETKKNKDIVISRLKGEIDSLEYKIDREKEQLKQIENDEVDLKYDF